MLIINSHDSHVTLEVIEFCVEYKILLLCLPPHSTNWLQPYDVGLFSPTSQSYRNKIRERSSFTSSCTISKIDFLKI